MLASHPGDDPTPVVAVAAGGVSGPRLDAALRRAGLLVTHAPDPAALPRFLADRRPDVAVVLIRVGTAVPPAVLQLRSASPETRLLVLDGEGTIERSVGALGAGADACLSEPADVNEVVARVRALLRRRPGQLAGQNEVQVGDVRIDLAARVIATARGQAGLTSRECDVMALLAAEPGRAVPARELNHRIWGDPEGEPANLRMQVSALRAKLVAAGATRVVLQTVWGFGYRLEASA